MADLLCGVRRKRFRREDSGGLQNSKEKTGEGAVGFSLDVEQS
jgi:hypothetical protein